MIPVGSLRPGRHHLAIDGQVHAIAVDGDGPELLKLFRTTLSVWNTPATLPGMQYRLSPI